MSNRSFVIFGAFIAAVVLSGCSDTRKALGLDKSTPDEFNVVSRAPLSLPPDYRLRPPQPGATRPQEGTVQQQAKQSIFRAGDTGEKKQTANLIQGGRSEAEMALLRQAGAGQEDPNIRRTLNAEATKQLDSDKSFVDTLLFWRAPQQPGTVIDAQKENQRLRENLALGKSTTEGETPIIQRKKKALLEGIF
jgi:hypothetical protein